MTKYFARIPILGLLCWLVWANPAQAWNAMGHKIIASIAFRQLSAAEQSAVVELLQRHPRHQPDFVDVMADDVRRSDPASQHEWLFQQAAIWPDTVRGGPPEKRAFNRSEWHYINRPRFLDDSARGELEGLLSINLDLDPPADASIDTQRLNVVQVIRFARRQIADKQSSPDARAVLLAWLFHNVGDLHQPLHSTALFSKRLFPEGDRGGNSVKTAQTGNLHALWDQFPGQADNDREARNRAVTLMSDSALSKIGVEAAKTLDAEAWTVESHELAKTSVYDDEVIRALKNMERGDGAIEPIHLSERYLKVGGQISERRIVQAGYRLGAVLKELFRE